MKNKNVTKFRSLLEMQASGLFTIKENPIYLSIIILYMIFCIFVFKHREFIFNIDSWGRFSDLANVVAIAIMIAFSFMGLLMIIGLLGLPSKLRHIEREFEKIGFKNSAGEMPRLISALKIHDNQLIRLTFDANGIPISDWKEQKESLELAFNSAIVSIKTGTGFNRIQVLLRNGANYLPDRIDWQDDRLNNEEFKLLAGESLLGEVIVDLNKTPHGLIAGSTGSGKSMLVKLFLLQAYRKNATIYIADFKGGIDYSGFWKGTCTLCTNKEELVELLGKLVDEIYNRQGLFIKAGVRNISEYNAFNAEELKHIVFAFDEIAEVLDKTGLSKEEKAVYYRIQTLLSTIARLGRAFGIHLLLATQRPDAEILSGQIRSNIGYRICGYADETLSRIILGDDSATDMIAADERGRFVFYNGRDKVLFQAYYLDDNKL